MDMFSKCISAWVLALLSGASGTLAAAEHSATLIVWAGTLLTVPGQAPSSNQSIVLRDRRIQRISPGRLTAAAVGADPTDVRIVDLTCCFVLPGLFDLHVHLTTEQGSAAVLDEVTLDSADLALRAATNAERTLQAGFTTVLDMGTGRRAHELAIFAVRDAIAGRLTGPRILAVGSPISSPGNSRTAHYTPDIDRVIAPQGVCSGVDDCIRAVREQVERGADVINFYNTGSLLAANSPAQTFTDAEMSAIVSTAHSLNRKVVADGAGRLASAAGVDAAIRAGSDWIDTVIYPGKDTWSFLSKNGHMYAPHLYAMVAAVGDDDAHLAEGSMGWLPVPILQTLLKLKRERPAAVAAHAAGIRMIFSSDAGVFAHGRNAGEFAEYVRAGLTPAEAIATATVNAASVLGLIGDSGTLEVGKRADMIAVNSSPLQDIRALENVQVVIRGGDVVKSRAAATTTATADGARPAND
jgi:imidazolonepropionase-like amidohydrolase